MKPRRGMMLIELMAYMVLFVFAMNLVTEFASRFGRTWQKIDDASRDLEVAGRFLEDLKADLFHARIVGFPEEGLALQLEGDVKILWQVDPEAGTVTRTGGGPDREYPGAFGEVTFRDGEGGTVQVDLELVKHEGESPFRPRMRAVVLCPNRGPR